MVKSALIVVNYNGGEMILATMKRLKETQPADSYELFLIDNGSNDGSREFATNPESVFGPAEVVVDMPVDVELHWESIADTGKDPADTTAIERSKVVKVLGLRSRPGVWTAVSLARNYGFEGGANIGLLVSGGGWDNSGRILGSGPQTVNGAQAEALGIGPDVVLMGSDVWLQPDTIPKLIEASYAHPQIGICGPMLLKQIHGQPFVVGGGYTSNPKCLHHRGWKRDAGPWHFWQQCPWVTFSLVAIKRQLIGQVGLLDMCFHFYGGDSDYCKRGRARGWSMIYTPVTEAYHGESLTVGKVKKEIGEEEWELRQKAEQRYHHLKWKDKKIIGPELPAGVLDKLNR